MTVDLRAVVTLVLLACAIVVTLAVTNIAGWWN